MKRILCLICALLIVLCGCNKKEEDAVAEPKPVDASGLELPVSEFAEGLFNKEITVLKPLTKEGSELYNFVVDYCKDQPAEDILVEFYKEYTECGGVSSDFNEFKDYARDISASVLGKNATVDATFLTLKNTNTKQEGLDGKKPSKKEKKAVKADNGVLKIEEKHYYETAEGEIVGEQKTKSLSYEKTTLSLEKIDDKWYVAEMVK